MAKDRIESKYVTVAPGVELHILEKGEGKPLVFIPGLTFSGEIFKNQLEYTIRDYQFRRVNCETQKNHYLIFPVEFHLLAVLLHPSMSHHKCGGADCSKSP